LRKTAINLAVNDHGIDQHATVLDDDVVENLDIAEIGSTATVTAVAA